MFGWFNTRKKQQSVLKSITFCEDSQLIKLPNPILPKIELGIALQRRRSTRQFIRSALSLQELSNLLWCASGVNKELSDGGILLTAPTASNHQEIVIYVFNSVGCYRYEPRNHSIKPIFNGDVRALIGEQSFVANAPVIVAIAADYSKMTKHNAWKRKRYSCVDAGYVSQNIYLHCAAEDLATVACGKIHHDFIKNIIGLKKGDVILCHPIG